MAKSATNTAVAGLFDGLDFDLLKKILDNSFDEIFVIDKDQTILYVNPSCEANYGIKQQDIIGTKAYDLIQNGYCFPAVAPEVIKQKKQITIEQSTSTGKKLLCTATPVLDATGEIELIIENSRDVTQLEMIKQDLEDAQMLVKRYKGEIQELRQRQVRPHGLIAQSKIMRRILELVQHVAPTDSTIFVHGKSGTGKGVLTKYIHQASKRRDGPFITINCAAIPEALLESELFGYEKGAFTGASSKGKLGLIELANEGTLFLDEIAELPVHLQSKLLDVIQEHRFYRVGGQKVVTADVRIIAATNRPIKKMIAQGRFREDLYYRLSVVEIELPPLKERINDLMPLIYLFLNRFDRRYTAHHVLDQKTLDILLEYDWPGNVRELEHLMERLVVTVPETTITPDHLPADLRSTVENKIPDLFNRLVPLENAMAQVTAELVKKAYSALGSSYKVAAALNISQSRASRLIRKHITGKSV